jgi:hypothetical protein
MEEGSTKLVPSWPGQAEQAKFFQTFPRIFQTSPRKIQGFPNYFQGIPNIFLGGFQRYQSVVGDDRRFRRS